MLENQSLATSVALRYRDRGVESDDLNQVASTALVLAVHRYQVRRGRPFEPFALLTIAGEIKRYFRDLAWMVRPPRRLQELGAEARGAESQLAQEMGRLPTTLEVAEALGVSVTELGHARTASSGYQVRSLDAPVDPGAETSTLGEQVRDPRDDLADRESALDLQPALDRLDDRTRLVLQLRFGDGATQDQIGGVIGVSQMHVSRILGQGLNVLRRDLAR